MINDFEFFKNAPRLDLHGEDSISAKILTEGFLLEQYKLGKKIIYIVHGKGTGILRKTVHDLLKKMKYIKSYKLDVFNSGITIVELDNSRDK